MPPSAIRIASAHTTVLSLVVVLVSLCLVSPLQAQSERESPVRTARPDVIELPAANGDSGSRSPLVYLPARPLSASTLGASISPHVVTTPTDPALKMDGDLDLVGNIFQSGIPFLHSDGGPAYGNTGAGLDALISADISYFAYGLFYGSENSAFGHQALMNTSTGLLNTAVGSEAMKYNTEGSNNVAVGFRSLAHNFQGVGNIAVGGQALYLNSTGNANVAVGNASLLMNTSGYGNTALGSATLLFNEQGIQNTALGYKSMYSTTYGFGNTAAGSQSLYSNSTGTNNVAIGYKTMWGNTTGVSNVAIGDALRTNSTGSVNVALGDKALRLNETGNFNIGIGYQAGSKWTTGNYNIAIGYNATGSAGESGQTLLGSFHSTDTFIYGIRGATGGTTFDEAVCTNSQNQLGPCTKSSRRFKEAVAVMGDTAQQVSKLRPVTFRYLPEENQRGVEQPLRYGLIAEEVAQLFPSLVSYDEEGQPVTVQYAQLTPLLLNEIQRQEKAFSAELDRQEAELKALRTVLAEVAELRKTVADQQRTLELLSKTQGSGLD